MNKLKWQNWNEGINMYDLKWRHWSEWIETNEFKRTINYLMTMWSTYEIELSLQSCAHFVNHFPGSSRATAETETLQRRPRTATLPEKNTGFCGFALESVFKREFTRSRSLTLPNYLMMMMMMVMMVMMTMWLTWWLRWLCGGHDDGVAMMVG